MTTPNQPGWYDDPRDANAQRYWDGQDWTPHRQRKPNVRAVRPPVTPAPPQPPPPPSSRADAPTLAAPIPVPPPPPSRADAPTMSAPIPVPPPHSPPPSDYSPPPPHSPPPADYFAPPPHSPPPADYFAAGPQQWSDVPTPPPPPAWPPPSPQTQGAGAQTASEGLAAVKGFAVKLSITAWLLFGGFVIAAIGVFFKWVTVSAVGLQADGSPFQGFWIFVVLLVIAGAAWLAWPTVSGSQLSVNRLIGLTVAVGLIVVGAFVGFAAYVTGLSDRDKEFAQSGDEDMKALVNVSIGPGLILYTAATVAIVVGIIRLWRHRSRTQNQTY